MLDKLGPAIPLSRRKFFSDLPENQESAGLRNIFLNVYILNYVPFLKFLINLVYLCATGHKVVTRKFQPKPLNLLSLGTLPSASPKKEFASIPLPRKVLDPY